MNVNLQPSVAIQSWGGQIVSEKTAATWLRRNEFIPACPRPDQAGSGMNSLGRGLVRHADFSSSANNKNYNLDSTYAGMPLTVTAAVRRLRDRFFDVNRIERPQSLWP